MLNICKTRKILDFYRLYDIPKSKIGDYLNTWFEGNNQENKKFLIMDSLITFKKVDKETYNKLYCRWYNPIEIYITCPAGGRFKYNESGDKLYNMSAFIHSIDDSSFTIRWNDITLVKLREIRIKVMKYVSSKKVINGNEFLELCINHGADKESIDYD